MNASREIKKVAVVGYNRIPFARINTAYVHASNQVMLTEALNGLISRYHLQGRIIGEVAGGAVIKHTRDSALVRESVLRTKLDPKTPAVDLQQACATGVEAVIHIANKIALGEIECGIACGVDSTSDVPLVLHENLRKILLDAGRSKSITEKIKKIFQVRFRDLKPVSPENKEQRTGLSMGDHTEITAKTYGISRIEQDLFALESHQKMAAAYREGFFEDMLTPYLGLEKDNNLRADSTFEKLSSLAPAFDKQSGTLTAGNSTPLTDGSSSVLLASEDWAREMRLPVLAYITFAQTAAIEYTQEKENLLLAPVIAMNKMLEKAKMSLADFDYYEIHEAFAAQVLATLKIWESEELSQRFGYHALGKIDRQKLNVKGGSLAAAHPFAATGGRIVATLAKLLAQKGSGKGLISVCAAGGQGVTMILER